MKLAKTLALAAVLAAFAPTAGGADAPAATIYSGGPILTMEGDSPHYVQALVEQGGRIVFVGTRAEARRRFAHARSRNLAGRTLLPGFLDGHGHMYYTGFQSLLANLLSPPDGPGASHDGIVKVTRDWAGSDNGKLISSKFGWIMGAGYDDSQLSEKQHPTADVLDRISTELPVIVIHQSGHLAVVNHKALELMGITRDTPNPQGGVIRRNPDGTPNGVLEEMAYFRIAFAAFGKADEEVRARSIEEGQRQYARWGYTTAQDGRSAKDITDSLAAAAGVGKLYLDVVAYPDIETNQAAMASQWYRADRGYSGHYRIGGAKLTLDGSPQGKTAWLTHPYLMPPEGRGADYRGYPSMSEDKADAFVALAMRNHWQLLVHANGDAAIDEFIGAVAKSLPANGYPDRRFVLIHAQTLRHDQIARLGTNGILPSLFPMHTFYWGDWHVESVLGHPRADYISPTRDVLKTGLTLTSHHDAPVTFPNSMRVLDATVNRVTRSGKVLGPDQRLTPYEGLRSLTAWAAFQYFEEGSKGTLSEGKLADLVILDANPLTVAPRRIHDIKVLETIKEGRTVYAAGR